MIRSHNSTCRVCHSAVSRTVPWTISDQRYAAHDVKPDDLIEIVFTSGTTAEPKGVCLTHRNLLTNLAPIDKEFGKYARWERLFHPIRFLCLLPLSHVFGQLMGIFVPQIVGGLVYFRESYKPSADHFGK